MKEKIREALARRQRQPAASRPGLRPAAVLLPLFLKEEQGHIILTRRTHTVEHHKGQISFPGGGWEEGDDCLCATALRESYEEIGLRGEDVEVLGELDPVATGSNFLVSPFVGFFPYPYSFRVNPREAQELLEVPLAALLAPGASWEEALSQGVSSSRCYRYGEHVIWGVTAGILEQFLGLGPEVAHGKDG